MQNVKFPLTFLFKITTLSNDFVARDKDGNIMAYVKQKLFKLKEDITIYSDENKAEILYHIKADKWLDFNSAYKITNSEGLELGKLVRKGWRSFWKVKYEIIDHKGNHVYTIQENSFWTRAADGMFSSIPLLGLLSGYVFNPKYTVYDQNNVGQYLLSKNVSLIGRRFTVDHLEVDATDAELVILSLMMMVLLEENRG